MPLMSLAATYELASTLQASNNALACDNLQASNSPHSSETTLERASNPPPSNPLGHQESVVSRSNPSSQWCQRWHPQCRELKDPSNSPSSTPPLPPMTSIAPHSESIRPGLPTGMPFLSKSEFEYLARATTPVIMPPTQPHPPQHRDQRETSRGSTCTLREIGSIVRRPSNSRAGSPGHPCPTGRLPLLWHPLCPIHPITGSMREGSPSEYLLPGSTRSFRPLGRPVAPSGPIRAPRLPATGPMPAARGPDGRPGGISPPAPSIPLNHRPCAVPGRLSSSR